MKKSKISRITRAGAAVAVLGAAFAGLTAAPASAQGDCGEGPWGSSERIKWCNATNGWGKLSTTTFWKPGGNPIEAQVVLLKDGKQVPMTVYLDRSTNPGAGHDPRVVVGSGFAGTRSVSYGQWYRGCATDDRGGFLCTEWVKVG